MKLMCAFSVLCICDRRGLMKGSCRMDDGALVCICCSAAGKRASIVGCDNTTQFCNYIILVCTAFVAWAQYCNFLQ